MQYTERRPEVDTVYSKGKLYWWIVEGDPRTLAGGNSWKVQADSADHACAFICATKWIARTSLSARAE